jgi:hypothetical protein
VRKSHPAVVNVHSIVADPMFVDSQHGDFPLKPDSPALKLGFEPIPLDKIGPSKDHARATWPIREAERQRQLEAVEGPRRLTVKRLTPRLTGGRGRDPRQPRRPNAAADVLEQSTNGHRGRRSFRAKDGAAPLGRGDVRVTTLIAGWYRIIFRGSFASKRLPPPLTPAVLVVQILLVEKRGNSDNTELTPKVWRLRLRLLVSGQ